MSYEIVTKYIKDLNFKIEDPKSYFLLERYGYLSKSNPSFGSLNDTLVLGIHQKTFKHGKPNLQNTFGSKYQKIGSTYLSYNQSLNEWGLTIEPY